MNNNVNFFRKYRYLVSIIFALVVTGVYIFLLNMFIVSLHLMGVDLVMAILVYGSIGLVAVLFGGTCYKILAPITPEEKNQSELQNKKGEKFIKILLIIIIIISFYLIFSNYYNNLIKK